MKKKTSKLFGKIDMTWKKVIWLSILAGLCTGFLNLIPIFKDTSFSDIAVSFECWILFAILIIVNCKKPLEASLKCFVFFLISQPLVFLVESPLLGIEVFKGYPIWLIWTVLTLPVAYIAWYIKKNSILSSLILSVGTCAIAIFGVCHAFVTINNFPHHLLSTIFCLATAFLLPFAILKGKKQKIITVIITLIATVVALVININIEKNYNTVSAYRIEGGNYWYCVVEKGKDNVQAVDSGSGYIDITVYGRKDTQASIYCTNENNQKKTIKVTFKDGIIKCEQE